MKVTKKTDKTAFDGQDPKTFDVPSVYIYDNDEAQLLFYHCGELVSVKLEKEQALLLVKNLIKAEEKAEEREREYAKSALAELSGLAEQMENASKVSS